MTAGWSANFILQALQCKDITVYGNGTQTRSFCYVDDMVDGLIRMMNGNDEFFRSGQSGQIRKNLPFWSWRKKIIKLTKKHIEDKLPASSMDDPTQRKPDIALAKDKLGWSPKIDLEKGLIRTIEYFRNIIKKCIIRGGFTDKNEISEKKFFVLGRVMSAGLPWP